MTNNSNPVLSSLASSFLPLNSPSWWSSPNHSPTNHHTYYGLQQCAWRLLQSWWQYYRHHCGFRRSAGTNSTSRLYSKSCIYLTQPCLTWCCSAHSITNSLVSLPLTVMGAQVDRQLRKMLTASTFLHHSIAIWSELMGPCGAARTSLSNSWFSSLPTRGS